MLYVCQAILQFNDNIVQQVFQNMVNEKLILARLSRQHLRADDEVRTNGYRIKSRSQFAEKNSKTPTV
jgi:hypothetical protein